MKIILLSLFLLIGAFIMSVEDNDKNLTYSNEFTELNELEKFVIENKGTERPFTGIYNDHDEQGSYKCKRCGVPLFKSDSKFSSQCGWPSFDDAIKDKVQEIPDADGHRTEIVCANCKAHLGHVFKGEGYTDKNLRHCVNSVSLQFENNKPKQEKAYFAGGCFWGVEYHFEKMNGVISTAVGFMGGTTENPEYYDVVGGDTGHAETAEIVYDPNKVSFAELARLFFEIHNPTQVDRQGPDIGSQYRSAVFYTNEEQKKITKELIAELKINGYDVVTELENADSFYPAENYHQDYYKNKGSTPYCHIYTKRFK